MQKHWSIKALNAVILSTIVFGLLSVLANVPLLAWPAMFFTDIMVWPVDGTQTLQASETRLIWALLGGFLTSWGVLQYMVLREIIPDRPAVGKRMLLVSVLVWFVLDTSGSLLGGVPANALANVFFLSIYLLPILALPVHRALAPAGLPSSN